MPAYNAEAYLREAIDSILAQTYRNIEFVIVNDGSTDRSEAIIRSYTDPRIKYVINEQNLGIVKTRNRALEASTGIYVAIMDSDDVMLPDKIDRQVAFMESHPEYSMCATWFTRIDKNGKVINHFRRPTSDTESLVHLTIENFFCHSTVMFRGDLARKLRYDDEYNIVEDYELYYRLSKLGRISCLPYNTTQYRVHGENISTRKRDAMFKVIVSLNKRILQDNGIGFTEDQLLIHSNLLYYNFEAFSDDASMRELESWIQHFYGHFKNRDSVTRATLLHILFEKWLVICSRSGHKSKMVLNGLIGLSPAIYGQEMLRKFRKNLNKLNR